MIRALLLGLTAGMVPVLAPESESKPGLTSLEQSVEPLRNHFNSNKDRLRFVAILSPT